MVMWQWMETFPEILGRACLCLSFTLTIPPGKFVSPFNAQVACNKISFLSIHDFNYTLLTDQNRNDAATVFVLTK